MSWAGPEEIYLSTSLASYLDRKLLVLLRDGRKLMGTLRSFDQFGIHFSFHVSRFTILLMSGRDLTFFCSL
jgi:hypothetical protein